MNAEALLGNFFEGDSLPCSFANGISNGFITAYYGDVLANLIFDEDKLSKDILRVRSDFSDYLASTLSGGIAGVTALYVDGFTNNIITTILFFLFIYLSEHFIGNKDEDANKSSRTVVFDTIAVVIIVFVFGSNNRKSFFDKTKAVDVETDYLALLLVNIYFALRGD